MLNIQNSSNSKLNHQNITDAVRIMKVLI